MDDDEKKAREKAEIITMFSTPGAAIYIPIEHWNAFVKFCKEAYDLDLKELMKNGN